MKKSTRTSIRLALTTIGLVVGLAAGPGQALADDRPAPADNVAAQAGSVDSGGSFSRPAPADSLAAQNAAVQSGGSVSRPAPADNVAARAAAASSTSPVTAISADGFDIGDAAIGAGFALGVALLLLGGAGVLRGPRPLAQR